MAAIGSYLTGMTSVLTGQGSTPTASGVCAPFPGLFVTDGASFKTGSESLLTATTPPSCHVPGDGCFHTLPTISGTVASWPLNGSLVDVSGNGLTLSSVDARTEAPQAPTFVTMGGDTCQTTLGVDTTYDGITVNSKLIVDAAALRFVGAFTIQWLMVQTRTYEITYFCCCDPAGRVGGIAPDRIGSLYTFYSDGGGAQIADGYIGSNLPFPFYGVFVGTDNSTWGQVVPGPAYGPAAAFAFTRDNTGVYRAYRNGVLLSAVTDPGTNISHGNERFYIGGIESGTPPNGTAGNSGGARFSRIRVLDYARAPVDVAADAAIMLGL